MSKGFQIEHNGNIFNADEIKHFINKWDSESPDYEIFIAANEDAELIIEGVSPEFEIVFYGIDLDTINKLLLMDSEIAIFKTETEAGLYANQIEMYCKAQPKMINNANAYDSVIVNLSVNKTGAMIENKLYENVLFAKVGDEQHFYKTNDNKVIIYG